MPALRAADAPISSRDSVSADKTDSALAKIDGEPSGRLQALGFPTCLFSAVERIRRVWRAASSLKCKASDSVKFEHGEDFLRSLEAQDFAWHVVQDELRSRSRSPCRRGESTARQGNH